MSCDHLTAPLCGCPLSALSVDREADRAAEDAMSAAARRRQNARHSKENPNWQTPVEHVDLARVALGGRINLDPFSCASANLVIGAERYYTEEDDGFSRIWDAESVFVNHPGGTTQRSWYKFCGEFAAGNFTRGIWVAFSIEQLCVLSEPSSVLDREARWALAAYVPSDFSVCFLRKRIHFVDVDRPNRPSRPGHANAIFYAGDDPLLFERTYAPYGQIMHGEVSRRARRFKQSL